MHVWAVGVRPSTEYSTGKDLFFWDCEWQLVKARLDEGQVAADAGNSLMGGQFEVYKYLKNKNKGRMNIRTIWIGGKGARVNEKKGRCLHLSMQWLQGVLQNGGLEGDLTEMGFHKIQG